MPSAYFRLWMAVTMDLSNLGRQKSAEKTESKKRAAFLKMSKPRQSTHAGDRKINTTAPVEKLASLRPALELVRRVTDAPGKAEVTGQNGHACMDCAARDFTAANCWPEDNSSRILTGGTPPLIVRHSPAMSTHPACFGLLQQKQLPNSPRIQPKSQDSVNEDPYASPLAANGITNAFSG